MTLDVSRLRELASACRREDFETFTYSCSVDGRRFGVRAGDVTICHIEPDDIGTKERPAWRELLQFVAAANPKVILELLERLEKAEEALAFYADEGRWTLYEGPGGPSDTPIVMDFDFTGRSPTDVARAYFAALSPNVPTVPFPDAEDA